MSIDEIICKLECHDLLVKLASALDRGANDEAADFFSDDGVLVTPNGESVGPAVRQALAKRPANIITRHIFTNAIINPIDTQSAEGHAYILVYRVSREANDVLPRRLPSTPQGAGDWRIGFRKTATGWKISRYEAIPTMAPAE
jgi:hypothetical protein